eukprot:5909765-Amphidinium_carterae.1
MSFSSSKQQIWGPNLFSETPCPLLVSGCRTSMLMAILLQSQMEDGRAYRLQKCNNAFKQQHQVGKPLDIVEAKS